MKSDPCAALTYCSSARVDHLHASGPPQYLGSSALLLTWSQLSLRSGHLLYFHSALGHGSPIAITYGVLENLKIAHAAGQTGRSRRIDQKCRACVLMKNYLKRFTKSCLSKMRLVLSQCVPSSLVFSSQDNTLLYADTTHRKDWYR